MSGRGGGVRSHSPTRDRATPTSARVAALREGKVLPVTRGDMLDIEVGQVPGPHVRAVMSLASAIHHAEGDGPSVSWPTQERARAYFNEHGLAATLDECRRLGWEP